MEQDRSTKKSNSESEDYLATLLTSYQMSNALSNIYKEDAEALAILSQLNKQTQKFYKDLPLKSYLRQGNLETLTELIELYKQSTPSKRESIKTKINQIIETLSEEEYKKFTKNVSEMIPKTILKFVTANQLQKDILNIIELIVDLDLPIERDKWSQLFTSTGYFKNNLPLVNYLRSQRKRLIKNNEWNKKFDNTMVLPLRSGYEFSQEKWAFIVYQILGDELFELLPEEISKKIFKFINTK
jgi:hypothetical protein